MVTISKKDYRALEAKIQTEIQKIFSQFLEDLKTKPVETRPDKPHGKLARRKKAAGALEEPQNHRHADKLVPAETNTAEPKTQRKPKKTLSITKAVSSVTSDGKPSPTKNLEADISKIFRKKR